MGPLAPPNGWAHTDFPYNEAFEGELLQPSIRAARIAHQWAIPVDVQGDTPQNHWFQIFPLPSNYVTQRTYQTAIAGQTKPVTFAQSSQVMAQQAAYLKLLGPHLLGAP